MILEFNSASFVDVSTSKKFIEIFNAIDGTGLMEIEAPLATSVRVMGCADLLSINAPAATHFDIRRCTSLTLLDAPIATMIDISDCTSLVSINAPAAIYLGVSNCTSLTKLEALAATNLSAGGCIGLISLKAPVAEVIGVSGCRNLTSLEAPVAKTIYGIEFTKLPRFSVGKNGRGDEFFGVRLHNDWRVMTGFQLFTIPNALEHWSQPNRMPDCLDLVRKIEAEVARRESTLDDVPIKHN